MAKYSEFERIKLAVGDWTLTRDGKLVDNRKTVVLTAKRLGVLRKRERDETRGVVQWLFYARGGRLLVLEYKWSLIRGETEVATLYDIDVPDLCDGGRFAELGEAVGLSDWFRLDGYEQWP